MFSAPNPSDANLNLLHTPYQRVVSESSTSRRKRADATNNFAGIIQDDQKVSVQLMIVL
jgi:hypothetical protein